MTTQKCRFSHPLYDTCFEAELPVDMTFKEITKYLLKEGFLVPKKGGFQYIYDDILCKQGAPIKDYIPDGVECMEFRIHALLIILT